MKTNEIVLREQNKKDSYLNIHGFSKEEKNKF